MGFCSVDAQLSAAFDLKEKDKEESFVRRLATGICTVWNDNPKAFKWWREFWFKTR